jgi:hypothetical protein
MSSWLRKLTEKKGIPIITEDVGGTMGRRILFHTSTNEAIVMKTRKSGGAIGLPFRMRLTAGEVKTGWGRPLEFFFTNTSKDILP